MVSFDQEDMLGMKGYPDDYLNTEKRCRANEFAHNLHRARGLRVKVSVLSGAGTRVCLVNGFGFCLPPHKAVGQMRRYSNDGRGWVDMPSITT
jgi:hypothetical protein